MNYSTSISTKMLSGLWVFPLTKSFGNQHTKMQFSDENVDLTNFFLKASGSFKFMLESIDYVSDQYKNSTANLDVDEYGSMLPRLNDFIVYPNPVSDFLNIIVNLAVEDKFTIELSDMSGRLVLTLLRDEALPTGNSVKSFDISGLTSGMYIFRIKSGSYSKSGKITKK